MDSGAPISGCRGRGRGTSQSRVALLLVALALAVLAGCGSDDDDKLPDGTRIGGVDVGGKEPAEAQKLVAARLGPTAAHDVRLRHEGESFTLLAAELGVKLDAAATVAAREPRVTYDRAALKRRLDEVARKVDRPARAADIEVRDGKLERTRAKEGLAVDRAKLDRLVAKQLNTAAAGGPAKVPVRVDERPKRTLDDLIKRYPTVIGIDRSNKTLRLYKNLRLERRYKIAVGQQGLESSPGRYKIEEKIKDPPWHAPNKAWAGELAGQTIPAGDPRNPLEARWMGYHDGEGIHGTKDVDSLGTAASHGCIRMSPKAVRQLYDEVKTGTPVFLQ